MSQTGNITKGIKTFDRHAASEQALLEIYKDAKGTTATFSAALRPKAQESESRLHEGVLGEQEERESRIYAEMAAVAQDH